MIKFNSANYYQSRLYFIGNKYKWFGKWRNKWLLKYTLCSELAGRLLLNNPTRLSDLCLLTGLVSSRREFQRKLKETAFVGYNRRIYKEDELINTAKPSFFNEVRLGKKLLEWVVPIGGI